jgi:nitronate monooxygenase
MGVAVSDWRLARAVSELGHLGVVSGTALDTVMIRRLQLGDPGGDIRRALAALPIPGVGDRIIDRYFVEGGKQPDERFAQSSMKRHDPSRNLEELLVAANFVEVYLAKEGHDGPVGVNFLEKVQAPTLASLYGTMLAEVDYVIMGAGIPKTIPAVLDKLATGAPVELRLDVKGATEGDDFRARFDPAILMGGYPSALKRPAFLAIVSSHVLAVMLATKIEVPPDGFVVEAPTAGGHNAPPRGKRKLNEAGEPIYGKRDEPDLNVLVELGLPFWLAGGYAHPDQVQHALEQGATGVQVGTAFAFCEESAFDAEVKRQVLDLSRQGEAEVMTDPLASPSGFPFKVVQLEGTLSETDVYQARTREPCELGFLRTGYRTETGNLGWRCPAEPEEVFLNKGGDEDDLAGRKCLCNALLANVGLAQVQHDGEVEPMLITSGDEVAQVAQYLPPGADTYTAADVIDHLLPKS